MTQADAKPLTSAKRAAGFRERRRCKAVPTNVQFDRELRLVVIAHVEDATMTLAKAVALTASACAAASLPTASTA